MTSDFPGGPPRIRESFVDFLAQARPDLLPQPVSGPVDVPHGTTILALCYAEGVVIAGDRRMTMGYSIEHSGVEKVYPTDEHSAIAISGAAGPGIELARLFQVEIEFYEKQSGKRLSLEGRANFLGRLIRGNLAAAMQGMVVLPLFVGFDLARSIGRIFQYDVTGGRFEETQYHATGSGGVHAKNTLKRVFRSPDDLTRERAVRVSLDALADAAEEDAATGGPDPLRRMYPTIYTITAAGVQRAPEDEIAAVSEAVLGERAATWDREREGRPPGGVTEVS